MRINKKIRIALITETLGAAGSEKQLYELAIRLNKKIFEVFVICLSNITDPFEKKLKEHDIEVHVIKKVMRWDFLMVLRVYFLIKRLKIDIIHAFLLGASFYGLIAGKLAGIKSIISSNRGRLKEKSFLRYYKHRFVLTKSSAVVVNSRSVEEFTKEFYSLKKNNMHMIHNGLDAKSFSPNEGEGLKIKHELGLDNARIILGTAGRLFPVKNHSFLLQNAKTLLSNDRNIFFLLIGEGPLLNQLKEQSRNLDIEKNVLFLGRKINMADYVNILDIFVLTSDSESLPNAILEAMSLKKPVITFDVGGCGELVKDGVNGFLVPYMNHDVFCDKIRLLINDDSLRYRMGEAGKEMALKNFSMEKMVNSMESLYMSLWNKYHS